MLCSRQKTPPAHKELPEWHCDVWCPFCALSGTPHAYLTTELKKVRMWLSPEKSMRRPARHWLASPGRKNRSLHV